MPTTLCRSNSANGCLLARLSPVAIGTGLCRATSIMAGMLLWCTGTLRISDVGFRVDTALTRHGTKVHHEGTPIKAVYGTGSGRPAAAGDRPGRRADPGWRVRHLRQRCTWPGRLDRAPNSSAGDGARSGLSERRVGRGCVGMAEV